MGKKKDKKAKKKDRRSDDPLDAMEFHATITRRDRIMLLLAWAHRTGAVLIDGVTYPAPDGWVDSWLIGHRAVGGASGDRRLRELRAEPLAVGTIERRESVDGGNTLVEYRIAKAAQ